MSTATVNSIRAPLVLSILVLVVFLKTSLAFAGGLEYSTFLGGSEDDNGMSIAVDAAGDYYVTGETQSADFPTSAGSVDTTCGTDGSCDGWWDVYVTKLSGDGSGPEYSAFVGGSSGELVYDLAIDESNDVFITGSTGSADFPTTPGAYDRTCDPIATCADAFVTRINSTGTAFVFSTFLGGENSDYGRAVAPSLSGHVYATGRTFSPSFPTTGTAYDGTCGDDALCGGGSDAFITVLNPIGTAIAYSTFLGGSDFDYGADIALDVSGHAYLVGYTASPDFPTTPGAFDTSYNGGYWDAFVSKFNSGGSTLAYSTFLGGSGLDFGGSLALEDGNAHITGYTDSPNFPTTAGAFDQLCGTDGNCDYNGASFRNDAFIAKFDSTGESLDYSSFLGGSSDEVGSDIEVSEGSIYLAGKTASPDFPTTPAAFDRTYGTDGGVGFHDDAFAARLNPAGNALSYSTFLGGSDYDHSTSLALGGGENVYLSGQTYSADFPTTFGAYDPTLNSGDAFISILSIPDISVAVELLGSSSVSRGSTLSYEVALRNNTDSSKSFGAKTYVSGPPTVDPLDGPIPVTLGSLASASRTLSKTVPILAPLGTYDLCVVAFDGPATLDEACAEFEIVP